MGNTSDTPTKGEKTYLYAHCAPLQLFSCLYKLATFKKTKKCSKCIICYVIMCFCEMCAQLGMNIVIE